MTIEELFHAFTDADFQYTRFIKTRDYERSKLERFDVLIDRIKHQAIKMDLSPIINEEINKLSRLDLNFIPKIPFIRKFLGFITFGYSKKVYILRKTNEYFLREIHARHLLVQSIHNHLNEE